MKTLSIRISDNLHERLRSSAEKGYRSLNAEVVRILEKDAFKQNWISAEDYEKEFQQEYGSGEKEEGRKILYLPQGDNTRLIGTGSVVTLPDGSKFYNCTHPVYQPNPAFERHYIPSPSEEEVEIERIKDE